MSTRKLGAPKPSVAGHAGIAFENRNIPLALNHCVWTSPEEGRWSVALRGEAGPAVTPAMILSDLSDVADVH